MEKSEEQVGATGFSAPGSSARSWPPVAPLPTCGGDLLSSRMRRVWSGSLPIVEGQAMGTSGRAGDATGVLSGPFLFLAAAGGHQRVFRPVPMTHGVERVGVRGLRSPRSFRCIFAGHWYCQVGGTRLFVLPGAPLGTVASVPCLSSSLSLFFGRAKRGP